MVNRICQIGLKLTQKEYDYIVQKAQEDRGTRWRSGEKNLSAYIRKCVLYSAGFEKEKYIQEELNSLTYQIRKIGVNINQATKKINSNFYDIETTEQLHHGLREVEERLQMLIEKLEEIYGGNEVDEH